MEYPNAKDIERAVLSACLFEREAIEIAAQNITAEAFFSPQYGTIFAAIQALFSEGAPVDQLTLAERLKSVGVLDTVGGEAAIAGLAGEITGAANVEYHCRVIRNKALLRRIIRMTVTVQNMASALDADPETIIADIEAGIPAIRREYGLAETGAGVMAKVREYLLVTDRDFSVTDMDKELGIVTPRDKTARRQAIHRLQKEGVIVKSGSKAGVFRRVNDDCKPVDWRTAPTEEINLYLPMGLNDLVRVMPGNILLFAGESNAGKTALSLLIAAKNMPFYDVHYFSSEMGPEEFKLRVQEFAEDGITPDQWKLNFYERSSDFPDVLMPDSFNIFDYIEVPSDKPYLVGDILRDIHKKLNRGIAIVCLQRAKNAELGRGGQFTLDKPRLYLNIAPGKVTIVKAKLWRNRNRNPNGLVREFKLVNGYKFVPQGEWYKPDK
jgi:hypothetical protein